MMPTLEAVWAAFADPTLAQPAIVTVKVALITLCLHLVLGLGLGWVLAKPRWPGRAILDIAVMVPLMFPPLALGFFLLLLLGRRSVVGGWLEEYFGLSFVFTVEGVVLASVIAGLPLVVKPIEAAITNVALTFGEASRTLGRSEWETFIYVIMPNIRGAIVAGLVLGTARSLGEVGITLMLGGNIVGRTNTMSLEIYNAVFNSEYPRAIVLSSLLGIASIAVFIILRRNARPVFS